MKKTCLKTRLYWLCFLILPLLVLPNVSCLRMAGSSLLASRKETSRQNMHKLQSALFEHVAENNKQWPASLDEIKDRVQDFDQVMVNLVTGNNPGYLYVAPKSNSNSSRTVMLYQLNKGKVDRTLGVGYADGHVSLLAKGDIEPMVMKSTPHRSASKTAKESSTRKNHSKPVVDNKPTRVAKLKKSDQRKKFDEKLTGIRKMHPTGQRKAQSAVPEKGKPANPLTLPERIRNAQSRIDWQGVARELERLQPANLDDSELKDLSAAIQEKRDGIEGQMRNRIDIIALKLSPDAATILSIAKTADKKVAAVAYVELMVRGEDLADGFDSMMNDFFFRSAFKKACNETSRKSFFTEAKVLEKFFAEPSFGRYLVGLDLLKEVGTKDCIAKVEAAVETLDGKEKKQFWMRSRMFLKRLGN